MAGESNLLLVGRIGAAHGIKGEVRIQSFTEDPLALLDYSPLDTSRPGLKIVIEAGRASTNTVIARLRGVTTRNDAEALNGVELFVERECLPQTSGDDDFYVADLIGLDVVPDRLERGRAIGIDVIDASDGSDTTELAEQVRSMTDGRGTDSAIDAVGMEAHGAPMAELAQRAAGLLPDALAKLSGSAMA